MRQENVERLKRALVWCDWRSFSAAAVLWLLRARRGSFQVMTPL